MEDRISRIEETVAFLERQVEELDDVLRGLHDRFDGLQRQLNSVSDRLIRFGEALESAPSDEDGPDPPDQ